MTRLPATLLILSLGFGASGFFGHLCGQTEKRCLHPLPGDRGSLFVDPSGNLCRELPPPRSVSESSLGSLALTRDGNSFGRKAPLPRRQSVGERPSRPGTAFLLSLGLPGLGQRLLGQGRWTAYMAAEVWAWLQYSSRRREGEDLQREYRDLAWMVARRVSSGPRQDGPWEYYEALTKYRSSGAFDSDPLTPGIQPEEEEGTFNGSIWALANDIFLPEDSDTPLDPDSEQYRRALEYYASRAYPASLAWDWGGTPLHQAEFINLIRSSDEKLRRSTAMIGVILANHLLSSIDALVSGRLGMTEDSEPRAQLQLLPAPFASDRLALHVRLPLR